MNLVFAIINALMIGINLRLYMNPPSDSIKLLAAGAIVVNSSVCVFCLTSWINGQRNNQKGRKR